MMIRTLTAVAAAPLIALAAPAASQDIILDLPEDVVADEYAQEDSLGDIAGALSDPAQQEALATSLAVMTEVILDLPLAPFLEPLAQATGADPARVDRDATLRKLAPRAGVVSAEIQDKLPRAMDGIASMTGAVARMAPALRDMAARVREALPATLPYRDRE